MNNKMKELKVDLDTTIDTATAAIDTAMDAAYDSAREAFSFACNAKALDDLDTAIDAGIRDIAIAARLTYLNANEDVIAARKAREAREASKAREAHDAAWDSYLDTHD